MSKIKSYVKQSLAFMQGDTNGVVAEQNYRTVDAGVNVQIAMLEAKKVEALNNISDAEENVLRVKHPSTRINDVNQYFKDVQFANEKVEKAKEALTNIEESIKFYNDLKQEFNAEVEA